jgi:phosphatidylglycerol:prolipoprotein diacylglycerol transferase
VHLTIGLDPVLVALGPWAVRWFGLFALLGIGVAIIGTLREVERTGLSRGAALDALAWALPAGVIFARVVYVLGWWDYYFTHGAEVWRLDPGGLSLWGGLIGGGAIGLARLRGNHLRLDILAAAAPSVAFGLAIARLGEFLDGRGQGIPSDLPWATVYSNPLSATPDFGVPRHPAQLYDGLIALALGMVLARTPTALRVPLWCVVYGGAHVALGAVRTDPAFLFGWQIEQLLALGVLAYGGVLGVRLTAQLVWRIRAAETAEARPREDSIAA